MRPQSIILFERLVLATIALGVLASAINWQRTLAMIQQFGFGATFIVVVQACSVALMLLLLYFVSRRGSEVAKWIYVVLVVIGGVNTLATFNTLLAMGGSGMIAPIQLVLQLIAIWLLFRPDSAAWFSRDAG
ncbi:hypothetical protein SAMN06295912_10769 [Sphingomonas laterariae]|uniref:Uncharacterized protein n=1 Tax=Edaphosphingomonas laterariae TaxID=861865 RepID=A0A239ESJ1_9SPHN|nr:hypothetical protein [Sphingomonas laterariae]SNS47218.1 hypothetical protein SAMN06295912_10769 [Sphingomonas laterariae]